MGDDDAYACFMAEAMRHPETFWLDQAKLIEWTNAPQTALDYSDPPFARWFPDGKTNLCVNAVDRWAARTPDAPALIHVSSETGAESTRSFAELLTDVRRWAASLRALGVEQGDRVMIYLPMIPEAVIAMLACARIGAIHAVVFGGFSSGALAVRIDDAEPKVIISADAGLRGGRVIAYKPILDAALAAATHKPGHILLIDRGHAPWPMGERDLLASAVLGQGDDDSATPLPATHPSYILYTSGTTGLPKGVQRDTGGYAVALAASMRSIFLGAPGGAFFAASDIGWVVGHSYIVYGPLIAGMATVLYEGLPNRPDPGALWRLAERYRVSSMFLSPTALRLLKKEDDGHIASADLSALKALFVAGEPLDVATSSWIKTKLSAPIIDNYWQTETGWPILAICLGVGEREIKAGSPGLPVYGYDVCVVDEKTCAPAAPGRKGLVAIKPPLPPGCMSTIWRDDARFVNTYFQRVGDDLFYSTFDWGVRDEDGYIFILGRTDDVINVAGHRLGTREIEEAICRHPSIAEAAVVGVHDDLRTQTPVVFVVRKRQKDAVDTLTSEIVDLVTRDIGAIARPSRVHWVDALPKTRSGKILRRAIQAVCEGRDPGDLSTIEDPAALEQIAQATAG